MIPFLSLKDVNGQYADELKEAACRVIDSGWYLQGSATAAFEQHYADYIGTRHCVGVANGLDALTLIYRAYIEMGVMKPGDEVIVPANTFIASILAITENGLTPVLVEPDEETLEIDDRLIEAAITPRTRSLMVVHLYGRCAYTERMGELCRQYGLKLVEDNAQAHGCWFERGERREERGETKEERGKRKEERGETKEERGERLRTGSLGDAAGHSFYPGKNLGALGDGGAVTTDDTALADCLRALANYGSQQKYVCRYRGRNSRLDELQAALLDVRLRHLDDDNRHRQQVAAHYYDHIENPLVRLPRRMDDAQNVYHLFPVLCPERDRLQQYLRRQGIQTLIHYPVPPHRQQCYAEWHDLQLPITERIHEQELSLPMSPVLTMDEARRVVEALNAF